MKEADVLAKGFAMPLTSPAFPCGPYRFVNREYLIITYRTHLALPNSPGKAESSH
jgi:acetoacetate decarboxylase